MRGARFEWPRLAGLLLTASLALAIAQSVYRIPIQVGDSLDVILLSTHPQSSGSLLLQAAGWSPTTLRPMRYVQARWLTTLAEWSGGAYHAVFRGVHATLAVVILGLFVWVANPRRWIEVAALGFALTVLIGLHTFDAMMREAFPVNHFAEVAAAALFVLGVANRPPRLVSEVVAVVLLAGGLLLVESAVLIWVVIVTCAVLRMPGIRTRTAVFATLMMAAWLVARWVFEIGSPGIGGHSSGWGALTLSGDELERMFAGNPLPFYIYNIIGGALSLLASEPRFGVYQLLAARESGSLSPVVVINLASSLLTTATIAAFCVAAVRTSPRRWSAEHRTLAVGTVVIAVSAGLCANYIKDDIISTAGVFYAVMSYAAARWSLERLDHPASTLPIVAVATCLVAAAPLWAFRAVGTHYDLRRAAFTSRNDWALQDERALSGGDNAGAGDLALTGKLRRDALRQPVTSPSFLPDWGERYWIE